MKSSQLTLLSSEAPANPSRSQEKGSGWTTRAATWPSSPLLWLHSFGPAGWFSRTSPVSCRRTRVGILGPSSGSWNNAGMGGPTESLTLSLPEYHSAAGVCSLSALLETGDLPPKYFLSQKACRGILRRAEKRGKELPGQLRRTLEAVAAQDQ